MLQNPNGRFLHDLGSTADGTYDSWVSDPNDAMQWASTEAPRRRLHELTWRLGQIRVVEIEFILNRHGEYDWLIGGLHACA